MLSYPFFPSCMDQTKYQEFRRGLWPGICQVAASALERDLGILASLSEQQNLTKPTTQRSRNLDFEKESLGGRGGGGEDVVIEGPGEGDGQEAGIRVSINRYAGGNLEAVNQPAF